MYTIDNIEMKTLGLHIMTHKGQVNALDLKNMYFTSYESEGFQVTKRKANVLFVHGFILGVDKSDFTSKLQTLTALLKSNGLRNIVLNDENETINCFAKDGFKISKVRVGSGFMFGFIEIQLTIDSVVKTQSQTRVFTNVFNSVFGGTQNGNNGIFNNVFSTQFS